MLEGKSILCFAPEPWDSMWRSRQQIMSRLATRNKVLFVEPCENLNMLIGKVRSGSVTLAAVRRPLMQMISDGLYVFQPPAFAPVSGRFPLSAVTEFARNALVDRAMKRLGFSAPILWLERPEAWDRVGRHNTNVTVYRVTDEYSAFVGMSPDVVRITQELEKRILSRADLVLVASEALYSAKKIYNPNTYLLPHGVDYAAFASPSQNGTLIPKDLMGLRHPIIGYSGLINARLDLALLRLVAAVFPRCTLALLGEVNPVRCESDIEALDDLENVVLLGRKSVQDVPNYVNAFDVCLIPYRNNDESRFANPLKLLEYLAAGKPVVAANTPAIREFNGIVRVATDQQAFLEQLGMALSERDDAAVSRRRELAESHSWDRVVERFSELVQKVLREKELS